jgi:hypothetical protein
LLSWVKWPQQSQILIKWIAKKKRQKKKNFFSWVQRFVSKIELKYAIWRSPSGTLSAGGRTKSEKWEDVSLIRLHPHARRHNGWMSLMPEKQQTFFFSFLN